MLQMQFFHIACPEAYATQLWYIFLVSNPSLYLLYSFCFLVSQQEQLEWLLTK